VQGCFVEVLLHLGDGGALGDALDDDGEVLRRAAHERAHLPNTAAGIDPGAQDMSAARDECGAAQR